MPLSIPSPSVQIKPIPLTPESFSHFGTLIQNPARKPQNPTTCAVQSANQGSALKYIDITHLHNFYPQSKSKTPANPVMNMFVSKPRDLQRRFDRLVFDVSILERHPFTPQTFIPLGLSSASTTRFLVIVAPTLDQDGTSWPRGPGHPDLSQIHAFIADGSQAVTYGAGTWHAPMVVLGDGDVDFVVVQWANGVPDEDCQEVLLEGGEVTVLLGKGEEERARAKL